MELTLHVICTPPQAAGFALAGLQVDVAEDVPTTMKLIHQLSADRHVGMVLVDATLHRNLPRELHHHLDAQARPLVTPFPSPAWDERTLAEEYVLEILRQAIGYRVRPR